MKVSLWAEIRRLHEIEKLSARAIASRLPCSRQTVQKALALSGPPQQTPETVEAAGLRYADGNPASAGDPNTALPRPSLFAAFS